VEPWEGDTKVSHTFAKNHLHVIFSTKDRRKTISKEIQPRLWSYMAGICRNQKISFEDEYLALLLALLRKHGIEYDPKYVLG